MMSYTHILLQLAIIVGFLVSISRARTLCREVGGYQYYCNIGYYCCEANTKCCKTVYNTGGSSGSRLSRGAIFGIVVGSIAGLVVVILLFGLIGAGCSKLCSKLNRQKISVRPLQPALNPGTAEQTHQPAYDQHQQPTNEHYSGMELPGVIP